MIRLHHKSKEFASIVSGNRVAFRLRAHNGMQAEWVIQEIWTSCRWENGRGKTLRQALANARLDRAKFIERIAA